MIRKFVISDLEKFEPTEISDYNGFEWVFDDDTYEKYTIVRGDEVRAVAFFRHNGDDDWLCLMTVSDSFSARDGVELRNFIQDGVDELKPKRLWTVSRAREHIAKWHEFLGMTVENSMIVRGNACNVWSIRWE